MRPFSCSALSTLIVTNSIVGFLSNLWEKLHDLIFWTLKTKFFWNYTRESITIFFSSNHPKNHLFANVLINNNFSYLLNNFYYTFNTLLILPIFVTTIFFGTQKIHNFLYEMFFLSILYFSVHSFHTWNIRVMFLKYIEISFPLKSNKKGSRSWVDIRCNEKITFWPAKIEIVL